MFTPEVDAAVTANLDLYPVYLDNSTAGIWVGPGPGNPGIWHATTRSQIASRPPIAPANVAVDALCESGCYSPDQVIRAGQGFVSVSKAHDSGERRLTTLAPDSTMDSFSFMDNTIARWTVDIAPAPQTIITFRMKSGGELRVTTEHPLVTGEGLMKRAGDLVVGESLVREDGAADPVVSVASATELTKVYNPRPTTTDLTSNILVAQGYLNGSARYQNEYLKYLNRVLIRNKIPSELIVRAPAAP